MMKKLLISTLLLCGSISISAQTVQWAYGISGFNATIKESRAIATDEMGNVYTTGRFSGTVWFGSGSGLDQLSSNSGGLGDIFVAKHSSNGNLAWVKSFGAEGEDYGNDIVVGDNGNVYITGTFQDFVDFTGTGAGLTGVAQGSPFLLTLDQNGDYVDVAWAGATQGVGQSVVYRSSSQQAFAIYNFNEGTNGYRLLIGSSTLIVSTAITNTLVVYDMELSPDQNHIYVTGKFSGTVDFEYGVGETNLTATGNNDVFVCKYSINSSISNLVWAKKVGGSQFETAYAIDVDESGYVYVAGLFNGTPDFDPGAGVQNVTTAGANDIFVLKLTSSGNFGWVKTIGSSSFETVADIQVGSQYFYLTGAFVGTVDFDPSNGVYNLTSTSSSDAYVSRYLNIGGHFDSAFHVGGNSAEAGTSIAINVSGNLCLTGRSSSADLDFDPSAGTYSVNAIGTGLAFIAKYCYSTESSTTVTACDSYSAPDGQVYTSSGNYSASLVSLTGCDSIVNIDLTVTHSTASSINVDECDSYMAPDGQTYTSSGVYNAILANSIGCDSIITINLSVNSTEAIINPVSCGPYLATNGQMFSNSGNYTVTINNAAGCDSVIFINLTVVELDNSTNQLSGEISSNQSGAIYQWLDCSADSSIIVGEQSQSFYPPSNGSYAVEISQQGCVDTSNCVDVYDVGLFEHLIFDGSPNIFPNPTSDILNIEFPNNVDVYAIKLCDVLGKVIYKSDEVCIQQISIDFNGLPEGVFYLSVFVEGREVTKKIVYKR